MKVYTKYENPSYDYPDQMELILAYLQANGELHVSGKTIEKLYREFSDRRYAAGWMSIDEDDPWLLEEFANWLEDINL